MITQSIVRATRSLLGEHGRSTRAHHSEPNRRVTSVPDQLDYSYLGNWEERPANSNIEEQRLRAWFSKRGVEGKLIDKAIYEWQKRAAVGGTRRLYDANFEVYEALRYGVKVLPSQATRTRRSG